MVKLSPSALETLSIIAYKQPIARSEIEQIRGSKPRGCHGNSFGGGAWSKWWVAKKPLVARFSMEPLRIFAAVWLEASFELPDLDTLVTSEPLAEETN